MNAKNKEPAIPGKLIATFPNRALLAAVVGSVLLTMPAAAQSQRDALGDLRLNSRLTLAPAEAEPAGGGGAADDEKAKQADLLKKSLNPVASLISVPFQNNWDFGIGPSDAMKYTMNFQPVIPISLNDNWNVISRTILPTIYLESTAPGVGSKFGLGDTLQSLFLSPKESPGGWIMGAGPALLFPTATDRALGSGQWGAGPTAVVLRQDKGFTYGALANHIWSYAGWGGQDVNATFLQPFVAYSTKTFTTFMVNTESTYDWNAHQWSVPVNLSVSQMLKIGKQPITIGLGPRVYAEGAKGGPDWGFRFAFTFMFPK
ncbi:MAG TPA: transporter [Verrucomicrobiae bacterium]